VESPPQPRSGAHTPPVLTNRLVVIMAVATGAVVANLYYAQPLLHQVARAFDTGTAAASTVITLTQVGYAAGLLLVVPLGDLHPRRQLVFVTYLLAAAALVLSAVAPSLALFELGAVLTGCASVAGQIMLPLAADLAPPERRGRVVARIMSGLLVGILLARTFSGLVAEAAGWRAIYWVSAALMVGFALVLFKALPGERGRPRMAYGALVGSSLRMLVEEPVVRRRGWHGACAFGAFSVLWTTLAFLLSGPPYHYSNGVIGLFGLVGVGGVLAANLAGKLADARRTMLATVAAEVLLIASFAILVPGKTSLVAVIIGILVLDIGTQGVQITNQALIYEVRPEARSRINSAYMVCYFVGGAVGSVTAGVVMGAAGWGWVCALGAGFGIAALAMAGWERLRKTSTAAPTEDPAASLRSEPQGLGAPAERR
jgi:predicted MFS family arabinose efflux permease